MLYFIATGSNLGDREEMLVRASELLAQRAGQLLVVSSIYETAAWGINDQPNYYNQVLALNSLLLPEEMLLECLEIEQILGRVRQEKWGPRLIDIDILFADAIILEKENLKLPHPYLHLRKFVLQPFCEIAPNWMHPIFQKTIFELLESCPDDLLVSSINKS